jgi:hypothetical protein
MLRIVLSDVCSHAMVYVWASFWGGWESCLAFFGGFYSSVCLTGSIFWGVFWFGGYILALS